METPYSNWPPSAARPPDAVLPVHHDRHGCSVVQSSDFIAAFRSRNARASENAFAICRSNATIVQLLAITQRK
jgi:hypothetical protein